LRKQPDDDPTPEQILAKEETEVGQPGRTKEALPGFGGKDDLEWTKHEEKETKTECGCGEYDHVTWGGPWVMGDYD
jgi:hypothetical protein